MGFPAGYTEVLLPKLLLNTLYLLSLLRLLISALLRSVGLSEFLDPADDDYSSTRPHHDPSQFQPASLSATLIKDMLPSVRFDDVSVGYGHVPETCAVCLIEYEGDDEIRRMRNCPHVFHRSCVDRWIDHDRKTCPLCRTCLVPVELEEEFNQRIWAASGIPEFYSEYAPITTF